MPGYTGYHSSKKSNWSATTIAVVVTGHIVLVAGIYQLSQTEYFQNLIQVSKLITVQEPVKPQDQPPPSPEKEPEPEKPPDLPPDSPPVVKEFPPEPVESTPVPEEAPASPSEGEPNDASPVASVPFAIGKGGSRFSGYEGILTAAIQAVYQPPSDLSVNVEYTVLCQLVLDDDGYVLRYKLLNSSGNAMFDRSAQLALSRLRQVRPPPPGMSRTVVVKFFPP
ncbi:MAG TPA: TonB family protein [Nitrospiraceae bacterium]|nr:TonB family protein [Nitrospiraceae bacterium]